MGLKSNRIVQYLVAAAVSVATVTMGMTSAWPTPVIPKFKDNETRVDITKDGIAWMLAMSAPGFVAGSFVTRYTLDTLGRRASMMWSALPYGLGMVIAASARETWLLCVTQFLWSCATGMFTSVISLYFAEISDKDIRGTLQLVTRITFNLGTLITMCIGPFLHYETLNFLLLVMPPCYLLACWWIPESPYFYLKEKKVEQAKKVLQRLRGYKNETTLEEDLNKMQANVSKEMRHSSSPTELANRKYRKAVIIAFGLKLTQIMTGMMTIQHYLGLIMKESRIQLPLATVIILFGVIRFVISILSSVLVDKVGRRPLLIYSYLGTGVSLAVVGLYFFLMDVLLIDHDLLIPYGFVTFMGIVFSNIFATLGFQSVLPVICGEIFPLNVKSGAMTSLNILGGVLSFVVARAYQALKDVIGLCGVFWVFAAVALTGFGFSLVFVLETKGKDLREIQEMLQGSMYEDETGESGRELMEINICNDDHAHDNDNVERSDNIDSKELEAINQQDKTRL